MYGDGSFDLSHSDSRSNFSMPRLLAGDIQREQSFIIGLSPEMVIIINCTILISH